MWFELIDYTQSLKNITIAIVWLFNKQTEI